jgi:predicted metalloprotease with PDZ domain
MARHWRSKFGLGLTLVLTCLAPAHCDPEAIEYHLSFPEAQHHYLEVEADIPATGASQTELFLPVWTPGSYMVREYARQLEGLRVTDAGGQVCSSEKISKNRWRVQTPGGAAIHLHYRVYCHEMSVRTCWVDENFALLNGAAFYLSVVGAEHRPYHVSLHLPPLWQQCLSGMPNLHEGQEPSFSASDYDQLLDCPILAGSPQVYRFKVLGVEHRLVDQGEAGGLWDGNRAALDVARIVASAHRLWGQFPYQEAAPHNYTFFNLLTQPGGGLEHKDSCVMMSSRWDMRLRKDYLGWLCLVAHEYFHCWNVKRLRPIALGPFDYEKEVYTPDLWVAEGFTEYYADLLVRRAGLSTPEEYLEQISHNIESLQTRPGRKVQALSESSFDAWIKFYRPDENSPNSGISYYSKGSLVGWLLDCELRRATGGKKSLDDLMRLAYQRYSGAHGYTDQQFRDLASEVAGVSLKPFFARAVDGVEELDYVPALHYYGLRFKSTNSRVKPGPATDPPPGYLGFTWLDRGGRLEITGVRRETPAYEFGLQVDDEVIALDDYRVTPEKFDERLKRYPEGSKIHLTIARGGRMLSVAMVVGKKPADRWNLEVDPAAGTEAKLHREKWWKAGS